MNIFDYFNKNIKKSILSENEYEGVNINEI